MLSCLWALLSADAESDSRLDEEVGSLIDVLLLGPPPPLPPSTPTSPALDPGAPAIASAASSSTNGAASPALPQEVAGDSSSSGGAVAPASPHAAGCGGAATSCDSATCHICMDNPVKVAVLGCDHEMCFLCARRLCAGQVGGILLLFVGVGQVAMWVTCHVWVWRERLHLHTAARMRSLGLGTLVLSAAGRCQGFAWSQPPAGICTPPDKCPPALAAAGPPPAPVPLLPPDDRRLPILCAK